MSINIEKLKLTLSTNIPGQKPMEFTKNMLYHPDFSSFPGIDNYPYITIQQLYPEDYLTSLPYDEIVSFFFNRNKFRETLNRNKPKRTNPKTNYSNENVTIMLKLLFSTKYFIVNNIHTSLDIITKKGSTNSIFFNPFDTKFSYIKVNGNTYTVTKVIWQNDIVNHPKYKEMMYAVNDVISKYTEEYPNDNTKLIKERTNKLTNPSKDVNDHAYNLRTHIIPRFKKPYRLSGNPKWDSLINTTATDAREKHAKKFYDLFESTFNRYVLNDESVKIDHDYLGTGVDKVNLGYGDNVPKREIFILLDVINGEVNEDNKKEVYCPYTYDYLGDRLNNLVFNSEDNMILSNSESIYSVNDKASSQNESISTPVKSNASNIHSNKETIDLFYKFFNTKLEDKTKTDDNKTNSDELKTIIQPLKAGDLIKGEEIFVYIKENNKELYGMIQKSSENNTSSDSQRNAIITKKGEYQTQRQIINQTKNQVETREQTTLKQQKLANYNLYIFVLDMLAKFESTKLLPQQGGKSKHRRKKMRNTTRKVKKLK